MQTMEVKVARIGNSRGVRIPAEVLRRYAVGDTVILIESLDGILLRPKHQTDQKLSWADTARAMASETEDWSEWDAAASDGLEAIPWEAGWGAEKQVSYHAHPKQSARRRS
jgi:antitoxin component of MazEF toxin-antitoxin module